MSLDPCSFLRRLLIALPTVARTPLLFWSLLALLLSVAHETGARDEERLGGLFKPGLEATLVTKDGEELAASILWFETPADLSLDAPGSQLFRFKAEPLQPSFLSVRSIAVRKDWTDWIASRASEMEYYALGEAGRASPPPPDWRRAFGKSPAWKPAAVIDPGATAPFLNRAQYCWAPPEATQSATRSEFLFRQRLRIFDFEQIVRATLRVTGRAEVIEIHLNELPVRLAERRNFELGEIEVTALLQPGDNLLAIRLRNRSSPRLEPPSLAFHLELRRTLPPPREPHRPPQPALVLTTDGGRLGGGVDRFDPRTIRFESPYGPFEVAWDSVRGILFTRGWYFVRGEKKPALGHRLLRRIRGGGSDKSDLPSPQGLPIRFLPRSTDVKGEILLRNGRRTERRPERIESDRLVLIDDRAQLNSIELEKVAALYPPPFDPYLLQKPRAAVAGLYCKLLTTRGDVIYGMLRQAAAKRVVLETPGGDFLRVPAHEVIRITFPYHGAAGAGAAAATGARASMGEVALIAQAGGQEDYAEQYQRLSASIQEAVFLAGLQSRVLPQEVLADPRRLLRASFPVLALVDPLGEYPDSLYAEGDVRHAIHEYVRGGGALILYSRGGAMRTAVVSAPGRFRRTVIADGLGARLGFTILHPNDPNLGDTRPFDRPPGDPGGLVLMRTDPLIHGLYELPERFELSPMPSAPFYPMRAANGSAAVYVLTDSAGLAYGAGLSLTRVERGVVIVIDHLLWESTSDDEPFWRAALPTILNWAAGRAVAEAN